MTDHRAGADLELGAPSLCHVYQTNKIYLKLSRGGFGFKSIISGGMEKNDKYNIKETSTKVKVSGGKGRGVTQTICKT